VKVFCQFFNGPAFRSPGVPKVQAAVQFNNEEFNSSTRKNSVTQYEDVKVITISATVAKPLLIADSCYLMSDC